jgi:hypothetical protein
MRALKLLTVLLLGLCLLGAAASAASGQALTLYDEGKPVRDGAKLSVEVKTDLCGNSQPEVWNFAAQMMANAAETVTVKIKSPKRAECNYKSSLYSSPRVAKLKELQLVANGTATVIGVIRWYTEEREHPLCEYRFHNTTGQFPLPGEARIEGSSVGYATPSKRAKECPTPTIEQKVVVTVRGSSGHILETRRA